MTHKLVPVLDGLVSPVDACFAQGRLYVADQPGTLLSVSPDRSVETALDLTETISGLGPKKEGAPDGLAEDYDERGLLGICADPPYLWAYYSRPVTDGEHNHVSRLSRFQFLSPDRLEPGSELVLLEVPQESFSHNGGCLRFGPDGNLYLSLGDGGCCNDEHGIMGNAQNLASPKGSILRMTPDGRPAHDNPFVTQEGADPLIWAYGFRNPWRFSFIPGTRSMLVGDVGEDDWESVKLVSAGENHGWRILEGGVPFDLELASKLGVDPNSLPQPVFRYRHEMGRSVIGGYLYQGRHQDLQGLYVFADASSNWWDELEQGLPPSGKIMGLDPLNGWRLTDFRLDVAPHIITSFAQAPNGELLVLTKGELGLGGGKGAVWRLD